MNAQCPYCGAAISPDDVNVARDDALCRSCERACYFAENIDADLPAGDLGNPPHGAWHEKTADGFVVGATTRSPMALGFIPFLVVWVVGGFRAIYGEQIEQAHLDLFQSTAAIPFLLFTIAISAFALWTVIGRIVVSVAGDEGRIFGGVGPIGLRSRFAWSDVDSVVKFIDTSPDHHMHYTIQIGWGRPIPIGGGWTIRILGTDTRPFGACLTEPRRRFLIGILRRAVRNRDGKPPKSRPDDLSDL